MLQVDLRGVTEIIFSEIHSVNLFLTKVLNWGSLTLTFRNINRYSLALYQDLAIGAASPLLKSCNWDSLTLTFRNFYRYSLPFHQDPAFGAASSLLKSSYWGSLTLTFRNKNRYSLIFTKISKEGKPHPHIQEHKQVQPHLH
jgi:hypothetical protein